MWKKISSGIYLFALVLFFMPWWSVSCGGQKALSLTGVQTAAGFEFKGMDGEKKIPPEPVVVAAGALILAGLLFGLASGKVPSVISALAGVLAGVLLLVFKSKLDAQAIREGQGIIQVTFENGFWATLFAVFAAAGVRFLPEKQTGGEAEKAGKTV